MFQTTPRPFNPHLSDVQNGLLTMVLGWWSLGIPWGLRLHSCRTLGWLKQMPKRFIIGLKFIELKLLAPKSIDNMNRDGYRTIQSLATNGIWKIQAKPVEEFLVKMPILLAHGNHTKVRESPLGLLTMEWIQTILTSVPITTQAMITIIAAMTVIQILPAGMLMELLPQALLRQQATTASVCRAQLPTPTCWVCFSSLAALPIQKRRMPSPMKIRLSISTAIHGDPVMTVVP